MSTDEFMKKMEGKPSPTYDQWNHDDQNLKHDPISEASDAMYVEMGKHDERPLSVSAGIRRS